MAKKQGKIIKLAEFRGPHEADGDVTTSGAESGTDSRSGTLIRKASQRRAAAASPLDVSGMDRSLASFGGDDEVSHDRTPGNARNGDA